MTVRAIHYDEYGKRTGTAEETLEELIAAHRAPHETTVPQMTPAEAFLLDRGTQRRPANSAKRFQ
jgi:hypothetical protein